MSEFAPETSKKQETHLINREADHDVQEKLRHGFEEAAAKAEHGPQEHQAEIAQQAKEQAISGKELMNATEDEASPAPQPGFINRELKQLARNRNLMLIRRRLSKPDKVGSKVIHQPLVAKVSELTENTVARPSGLLGGGIIALLGSAILLYMSKHYGFEYNYLAFFLLFAAGFAAGLLAELSRKLAKR